MVFIFYVGEMQRRQIGNKKTPGGRARMGYYRSVYYVTSAGKIKERFMRCHRKSGDLFAKSKTWGPRNYLGGEDVYNKAHIEAGRKEALDMAKKNRKESAKNRRRRREVPLELPRIVNDDEDEPEPPKPKKQKKQKKQQKKRTVIQLNPDHPDYNADLVADLRSGKIKL